MGAFPHRRLLPAAFTLALALFMAVMPGGSRASAATPACTLSDGSACPASYFNGPLGTNEIVPPRTGAFLIDQYGGIGIGWQESIVAIKQREAAAGRHFDSIQIQANPDPTLGDEYRERWILQNGHNFVTEVWNPTYDMKSIINGSQDALIAKAARYWRGYAPSRIMLRMFTEFNLRSDFLSNGYCGAPMRQAWQHIVSVFQANGASNVGFWFNPDEGNNRQCVADSYPGDTYVDWVGSDSYNWCKVGDNNCWATPGHSGPARFGELFDYGAGRHCGDHLCPSSMLDIYGPRKPFVVGETETISDSANPSWKPTFLRSIAQDAPGMKYLRGVSVFDFDVSPSEGQYTNFQVTWPGSADVLNAAGDLVRASWFTTQG